MDSMSAFRASWKVRLVAFGIGILVAAAVFGIALAVSDDLRLLYLSGALLLACRRIFAGCERRRKIGSPLFCFFSPRRSCSRFLSCRKHLFFGQRFCCGRRLSCGCYSGSDSPESSQSWGYDLNRGLSLVLRVLHSGADAARVTHGQWRGAAIHFATNQPELRCRLRFYTRQNSLRGSIFSPPGVLHVLLSCRSWSVFVPIYRPGATLNSCWLEQTKAAIRLTESARLHSIGTSRCRSRLIPNRQRCAHLV